MQHSIRRKDRVITLEECQQLLHNGEFCVLATADVGGTPYATPLSYVYWQNKIYFHSAHEGHKIQNLKANARCSLAVVGKTQPVYMENFTTYYESVIVHGFAGEVHDAAQKTLILMALARKYLPEHMDKAEYDIASSLSRTAVYEVSIEYMTGKAKRGKAIS